MITEDDSTRADRVCPACGEAASDATYLFCTACGARLDGEDRALVHVPKGSRAAALLDAEETSEGSWWRRYRRLLIIGTVVAVAVGAGGFVSWQWAGFRTADGPVRSFFAALEDGDGPGAAALLADAVFLNDNTIGTDEEILASPVWTAGALDAGYTAPELETVDVEYFMDAKGVERRPDKSLARAAVEFTLNDERFTMEFLMERETEGLNRAWTIGAVAMGLVPIGGSGGEVRVANTDVDGAVFAPPGVYEVAVTGSALFDDTAGQVMIGGEDYTEGTVDETSLEEPAPAASTVAPDDYEGDEYDSLFGGGEPLDSLDWDLITVADLDYRLDPAAAAAAEAQIRSAIDEGAAPHARVPDTCPVELVDMDETVAH
jgi:hypothetical protein